MMRIQLLTITFLSVLLSACSNAEVYQKEAPLEISTNIPKSLNSNQEYIIAVSLTQNREKVTDADFVHFEIIKQDGNINYGMSTADNEGNGDYSNTFTFDSDGLYFLRIHAGNNNSIIIPTQQLIVGTLTAQDKLFLQQHTPSLETNHGGHH